MRVPSLSIIIPARNTSAMTLACCQAVLATVPRHTEIIVVDDASDDDSVSMLEGQGDRLSVVRRASRGGFAAAANTGAREATGELLLFLNSDTQVAAGAMDALVGAFAADPSLGIAGASLLNTDGTPQWSGGRIPTFVWMAAAVSGAGSLARRVRGPRSASASGEVEWVSGAAMTVRRSVFESIGPFSEGYRFYCQDLELCARARRAGWRVAVIGDAHVVHVGGASAGADVLGQRPEWLWPDLVTWATLDRGASYGRLVRRTLRAAAWSRVVTRIICGKGPRHVATRACIAGARALGSGMTA